MHNNDRVTMYNPQLQPDVEFGSPNANGGFETVLAWIESDVLSLALRLWTTEADVPAALAAYPQLHEQLRMRPRPYNELLSRHASEQARMAIEEIAL